MKVDILPLYSGFTCVYFRKQIAFKELLRQKWKKGASAGCGNAGLFTTVQRSGLENIKPQPAFCVCASPVEGECIAGSLFLIRPQTDLLINK